MSCCEIVIEKEKETEARIEAQLSLAKLWYLGYRGVEKNWRLAFNIYAEIRLDNCANKYQLFKLCCKAGIIIYKGDENSGVARDFEAARGYFEKLLDSVANSRKKIEFRSLITVYECLAQLNRTGQGGAVNLCKSWDFYTLAFQMSSEMDLVSEAKRLEHITNTVRNEYVIAFARFCPH